MAKTQQQPEQTAPQQEAKQPASLDAAIEATEERASIVEKAASVLGVAPGKLCNLLRNVWATSKGKEPLSDQEMFSGISMIARYQLDPIAREIFVTRASNGRLITIVSIDGWIKILDRTPHYDGFEQEYGFDEAGKAMEWCETRIHSKDRKYPAVYRAYMMEYRNLAGIVAKQIPWHMLRIFSIRHAARLFTPLGAHVVTEEEARMMGATDFGTVQRDDSFGELDQSTSASDTLKGLQQPNGQTEPPKEEPPTTNQQSEQPPTEQKPPHDGPTATEQLDILKDEAIEAIKQGVDQQICGERFMAAATKLDIPDAKLIEAAYQKVKAAKKQ